MNLDENKMIESNACKYDEDTSLKFSFMDKSKHVIDEPINKPKFNLYHNKIQNTRQNIKLLEEMRVFRKKIVTKYTIKDNIDSFESQNQNDVNANKLSFGHKK